MNKTYKNNIAQIVIPFIGRKEFGEGENLVLKVENSVEVIDHKFFIHTSDNQVYQQYYKSIPKGENLLVLEPAKFKGYDKGKGIKKIVWQVYTNKQKQKGLVKVNELFKAQTALELEKIRSTEGENPQAIRTEPVTAKFDAKLKNSTVSIDYKRQHEDGLESYKSRIAQIEIPFTETRYFRVNENIVMKVDSDFDISNHKFFIYGGDDKVYQRYYLPIPKGKNIILLNPVGFPNYSVESGVKKLVWQIYTNNKEQGRIKVPNIFKTDNNFQLKTVFEDSSYNFEEKVIRGNIY